VWPLSVEVGWNQNLADWRFMLGAGRAFGCIAPDGKCRQARWCCARPEARLDQHGPGHQGAPPRRLGTGLLKRCIEEVRSVGAVAGLDATEQGRPIYLPLGFTISTASRVGTSIRQTMLRSRHLQASRFARS